MTERDDTSGGPTSPAASSTLVRAPSADAAAIDARAADAAAAAEEVAAEAKRAEISKRDREKSEEAARVADDARAPTGFLRSMRFFFVSFGGLAVGAIVTGLQLEGAILPWRGVFAAIGVWLAAIALLALDHATWRSRLPFALVGYDRIKGTSTRSSSHAPLVAFTVRIVHASGADSGTAREQTLKILASTMNAILAKDSDLKGKITRSWLVGDHGNVAGQATFAAYTTRAIEKWLRRDVRLLAKVAPIERVEIAAEYSGSFYLSSD